MTTRTELRELSKDEANALLDVWTDPCGECRDEVDRTGIATGHVVAGHRDPRRVVHSQLGGLGADWDEQHVRDFIAKADRIVAVPEDHWMAKTGHRIAVRGKYDDKDDEPRWYAFTARSTDGEGSA